MVSDIFNFNPYSLNKADKQKLLSKELTSFTEQHIQCCKEYASILDAQGFDILKVKSYYDLPFIPVRLFKEFNL